MPFIISTWRVIVAAWKHFTRNLWLALTTVFVLILALLSVNVLIGVNVLLTNAVKTLEDKIDVSVYFAPATPQAILDQAKFFMSGLPQVRSADLLTAEEALVAFKARHASDVKILGALGELDDNPLGATLVLRARKTQDYPFLLEALKNPQFDFAIQSKNYEDHAETIARVRDVSRSVQTFGGVLVSIFALFSVLIVYNTVRVAIYTQREEIGIMRLVGASGAYVRLPFVLEGIFLALLALVFASGLIVAVASYLDPKLVSVFDGTSPGLAAYFIDNGLGLLVTEGAGLAALVALSSWAAVGRYLRR